MKEGDLISLLNVYSAYKKHGASRRWCSQHFLAHRALARAAEIRTRMEKLLTKFEIPMRTSEGWHEIIITKIFSSVPKTENKGKSKLKKIA